MSGRTFQLQSILPGVTRTAAVNRGQYTVTVELDGVEVLTRIKGRPWTIAHDLDDLALVADAARAFCQIADSGRNGSPAPECLE